MASLGMKKRKKSRSQSQSQSPMIMTTSAVSSLDSSASQLHTHENVYSSRKVINNNKLDVPNNKTVQVEEESFIIEKRKSNGLMVMPRGDERIVGVTRSRIWRVKIIKWSPITVHLREVYKMRF